jgi:hypothetical protein
MTTITLEDVEIDLEQFSAQVEVFFRHMRKQSMLIPTSQSVQDLINEMIEEQSNASRENNSENGRDDSYGAVCERAPGS